MIYQSWETKTCQGWEIRTGDINHKTYKAGMGEEKYEEKLQKFYQTPEIFYIWVKFQRIKGEIGQLEKQFRIFSKT